MGLDFPSSAVVRGEPEASPSSRFRKSIASKQEIPTKSPDKSIPGIPKTTPKSVQNRTRHLRTKPVATRRWVDVKRSVQPAGENKRECQRESSSGLLSDGCPYGAASALPWWRQPGCVSDSDDSGDGIPADDEIDDNDLDLHYRRTTSTLPNKTAIRTPTILILVQVCP
eukprot:1330160-Amorphochlora_amoeboformis.AAC.2